jgi:transcriptional regulator GlxA family with amidase domain
VTEGERHEHFPARAGRSRAALGRRFTRLVGEPPVRYLTDWRIVLAADLLHKSNLTL